jgi:hypothetical protein
MISGYKHLVESSDSTSRPFHPEDGGGKFLQYVGNDLATRLHSKITPKKYNLNIIFAMSEIIHCFAVVQTSLSKKKKKIYNYCTWCTSNKSIALISLDTAAVRSMVGIDAHRIESTWIVSITRVLTGSSNTCFSQWAVIVARATHYIRATATRNMYTQEEEG